MSQVSVGTTNWSRFFVIIWFFVAKRGCCWLRAEWVYRYIMKIAGQTPAGIGYWDSNKPRCVRNFFNGPETHPHNQEKWLALHFQVLNFPVCYTRAPISNIDHIKLPLCIWLRQLVFEDVKEGVEWPSQRVIQRRAYVHTLSQRNEIRLFNWGKVWTSELVRKGRENKSKKKA